MPDKPAPPIELSVGEVAARCGVVISTIHFYEAEGLISSRRTRGSQRRFPRSILRRISIIKVAQSTGVPLAQIREAFSVLPDDRAPTAKDWEKLSAKWRADLEARITKLTRLRDQLGSCIGCGCLSLKVC